MLQKDFVATFQELVSVGGDVTLQTQPSRSLSVTLTKVQAIAGSVLIDAAINSTLYKKERKTLGGFSLDRNSGWEILLNNLCILLFSFTFFPFFSFFPFFLFSFFPFFFFFQCFFFAVGGSNALFTPYEAYSGAFGLEIGRNVRVRGASGSFTSAPAHIASIEFGVVRSIGAADPGDPADEDTWYAVDVQCALCDTVMINTFTGVGAQWMTVHRPLRATVPDGGAIGILKLLNMASMLAPAYANTQVRVGKSATLSDLGLLGPSISTNEATIGSIVNLSVAAGGKLSAVYLVGVAELSRAPYVAFADTASADSVPVWINDLYLGRNGADVATCNGRGVITQGASACRCWSALATGADCSGCITTRPTASPTPPTPAGPAVARVTIAFGAALTGAIEQDPQGFAESIVDAMEQPPISIDNSQVVSVRLQRQRDGTYRAAISLSSLVVAQHLALHVADLEFVVDGQVVPPSSQHLFFFPKPNPNHNPKTKMKKERKGENEK